MHFWLSIDMQITNRNRMKTEKKTLEINANAQPTSTCLKAEWPAQYNMQPWKAQPEVQSNTDRGLRMRQNTGFVQYSLALKLHSDSVTDDSLNTSVKRALSKTTESKAFEILNHYRIRRSYAAATWQTLSPLKRSHHLAPRCCGVTITASNFAGM